MQKTKLKEPVVIINFKAYSESSFDRGVRLANICTDINGRFKGSIISAPSLGDIGLIRKKIRGALLFSQHMDDVEFGSYTGHISIDYLKNIGIIGTLINHSERRVGLKEIGENVSACKKRGLISCVCVPDIRLLKRVVKFAPDYIAYEPPELIGGDICVTNAKTGIIKKAVEAVKAERIKTKVLCGAGVKSNRDLIRSLELGCVGVLAASGVVKAKSQRNALERLTMIDNQY